MSEPFSAPEQGKIQGNAAQASPAINRLTPKRRFVRRLSGPMAPQWMTSEQGLTGKATVRVSKCPTRTTGPVSSYRLRRSTQHLPEVYLQEYGILRSFSVVDSRAARPGRAALENNQTDRCLVGSIALRGDWCFRTCRVATGLRIQKLTCTSVVTVKSLCFAISSPQSHVSERFSVDGSLRTCRLKAAPTAPVSLLHTLISSIAKREWRSTSVAM